MVGNDVSSIKFWFMRSPLIREGNLRVLDQIRAFCLVIRGQTTQNWPISSLRFVVDTSFLPMVKILVYYGFSI